MSREGTGKTAQIAALPEPSLEVLEQFFLKVNSEEKKSADNKNFKVKINYPASNELTRLMNHVLLNRMIKRKLCLSVQEVGKKMLARDQLVKVCIE